MAKFKPYKIESSQLEDLAKSEGQFIVTTDTQKVYLDETDSSRIELSPSPTKTSELINDSDFMSGMYIAKYGITTYEQILDAYSKNHIVYCRASSSSNPASGSQTRMAFLAYVQAETNPTEFEFQYYRSVSTHSDSTQGDEVYIYKINKTNGWSVTKRNAYTKVVAGTGMSSSYSNGTITLNATNNGTVTQVTAGTGLTTGQSSADITSTGTLSLDTSGVTAGTYQGLTIDSYGRVTSASDQGYTSNTGTVTQVSAGTGLIGGDITSSGTIALDESGVTAGTYQGLTVDSYGRVTAASNQGYTSNTGTVTKITAGTGLTTGVTSSDITTSGTLSLGTSGVTAGTYQGLTVDQYGRVTAATDQGYTSNTGTITGITMNGVSKGTSGVVNLGTVLTSYTETDPIYSASAAAGITNSDITNWNNKTSNTGTITGVSVNNTSVATSGVANITSIPASILTGAIPSAVTATTQTVGDNSTKIATTAFVKTAINNLPDPMVFKGSLGTGGTITSLPVDGTANVGDTYKVITDGTYASKAAKTGDTFICLTKTSSANTWELIPSGDEPSGTVTSITIDATSPISIDSNSAITTSGSRTISHANSGVAAGTYKSVTVNATGHITAGTNPTTISGYGITDAKIDNGVITLGSNTITPLTSEVNSNLLNGSTTGSLRGIGTVEESNDYTIGSYAFAEGSYTEASGFASHAEGASTKATHEYCHVEGCLSEAYGGVSHAEGWNTRANAGSHAEGNITRAIAYNSHAEGSYSITAGGYGAHAEGNGGDSDQILVDSATISSINDNIITLTTTPKETFVGCYAQLSGSTSSGFSYSRLIEAIDKTQNTITFISQADLSEFSVGNTIKFYLIGSTAVGNGSHAEGSYTHAVGDYSHAEGGWTTAASNYQHVQGKYNILDLNSTYSDIIGNGTANNTRSNAATVDWSGNAWYAGDVYVGSTSGTNKDSGSVKLAKVSELRAAGTGLSLNGSTINHSNSVTAGTAGTSSATSGSTVDVPYVTYDAQGHITASGTHTHTISGFATTDTKNTAGTTNTTDKIYLAGGKSQGDNPQTYSNVNCYASGGKLYSNAKEVVNLSDTQALTNKTYDGLTLTKATTGFTIAGGTTSKTLTVNDNYTLEAACAKAVDSSISAASTSTNLPTSAAVASFVEGKGYTTNGIHSFYGTSAPGTVSGSVDGDIYIVIES